MSEKMIIEKCSPTLAGLKTGNLFSTDYFDKKELCSEIKRINSIIVNKGLRMLLLKTSENKALIYIYRIKHLKNDFRDEKAKRILNDYNYPLDKVEKCIVRLVERLKSEIFPHEIGLFLGYPPNDVRGFINKENRKYVGLWCVYDNVDEAIKKFEQYKKCTKVYCNKYEENKNFTKLVVAI